MRIALAAAAAGLVGLLALPLVAASSPRQPAGSAAAHRQIPDRYVAWYRQATTDRCPGLDWTLLAGIGAIESDHGRDTGTTTSRNGDTWPPILGPVLDGTAGNRTIADTDNGRLDGHRRWDRAVGPMQFTPTTWRAVGLDADGDNTADPHNAVDAIHTAAAHLCALGAGGQPTEALYGYNHSQVYVDDVLAAAARYGATPIDRAELATAVLDNPNIAIYAGGRDDIGAGRIDPRVLQTLQVLSRRWTIAVSSLTTGHATYVAGTTRISNHTYGRAADIYRVDGRPVTAGNTGARQLAATLPGLADPPDEIGTPWPDMTALGAFFSDSAHRDHLHLGWPP